MSCPVSRHRQFTSHFLKITATYSSSKFLFLNLLIEERTVTNFTTKLYLYVWHLGENKYPLNYNLIKWVFFQDTGIMIVSNIAISTSFNVGHISRISGDVEKQLWDTCIMASQNSIYINWFWSHKLKSN